MSIRKTVSIMLVTALSLGALVTGLAAMRTDDRYGPRRKVEGEAALEAARNGISLMSPETVQEMEASYAQQLVYRGCELCPAPDADGVELDLQLDIADVFRDLNVIPVERKKMFNRYLSNEDFVCTGWYGTIRSVSPDDQAWKIQLQISPRLASLQGGVAYTPDYCVEEWRYANGKLRFVRSWRPTDAVALLFVD